MRDPDLLVVGGGPSGLAAAMAARQLGMSVTVVEARRGSIDKACGEGIMPSGVAALRELGIAGLDGLPFVGIRYELASRDDCAAEGDFSGGYGLGVRRTELSAAMRDRAEELGVGFAYRTVREVRQHRGGVSAAGLWAPHLIAADGLRSTVRRRLGLEMPSPAPRRFGVVRHLSTPPWTDRVVVMLGSQAEAYVTPVAEDQIGVAMLHRNPRDRFDDLLPGFPTLAARVNGASALGPDRGAGPFDQRVRRRVAGRVLLVGDAAGYVDPLTGEGIALGMRTARAAVECIAQGKVRRYEAIHRTITRRYYTMTRALLAVVARPWLHRPLIRVAGASRALFGYVLDELDGDASRMPGPSSPGPTVPTRAFGRAVETGRVTC